MGDDLISVIDVAKHYGKHKQTIFKVLKRLRIETTRRRSSSNKNQLVAYITQDDLRRVSIELMAMANSDESELDDGEERDDFTSAEEGVFYLVQLEPEHDPSRFKLGFAASMSERLRHLKCSAPFASVVRTWPCRRLWERTAIDCVSAGCERLHTEVFRAASLDCIITRCEQFFAAMPAVQSNRSD